MIVKWADVPDVGADISRELEFQRRRGMQPVAIEVSPEAHEVMRMHARAPYGARLVEHDGLPVSVNPKMIGVRAWRVIYAHPAPPTEKMLDAARG